jgi:hypothetical protein
MRSRSRLPRSGMALCAIFQGTVLLAGAQIAWADTNAHPAAGALQLPNVRLETASPRQIAEANAPIVNPARPAVRAYKDPVSGQLRDQTPEEAMEGSMSKQAVSRSSAKAATKSPSGGNIMPLDETFMMNSVATKSADGTIDMQCLTGHDTPVEAMAKGKAGKAHRHDR